MQRVVILSHEVKSGTAKKTGQAFSMGVCQVNVYEKQADGTEKVLAGEMVLPKGHPEVKPGEYSVTFKLGGYGGKLEPQVDTLSPVAQAVRKVG